MRKKLIVADLANIEGRMLSWVSDEEWKLKAFREYDTILGIDGKGHKIRKGPDLYNVTAVSILGGDPWTVNKKNRNVFGKVPDLASGYMGGVAGYQQFAKAYGVRMADHWDVIQQAVGDELIEKAYANLEEFGRRQLHSLNDGKGISELEWLASEACKLAWRKRHPKTVKFWYALQDAARNSINEWGRVFEVGQHIRVKCGNHKGQRWMRVALPSGNYLTYFEPELLDDGRRGTITYMGEASEDNSTKRVWTRIFTHGGKMTGNVCQTLARDVLMPGLLEAERQGYMPVLSVHDEALTETPDTPDYTADGLVKILATNPPWSRGLPLAAEGFETYRYYKD